MAPRALIHTLKTLTRAGVLLQVNEEEQNRILPLEDVLRRLRRLRFRPYYKTVSSEVTESGNFTALILDLVRA